MLTALALSGLPVDRFCFEGFLPRKAGERLSRLREVAEERRTLVYFEAPHRLDDTLAAMAEVFGADRRAAVCRELTKTYEEVRRGPLGELAAWAAEGVRGEITVVVEGAPENGAEELDAAELVRRVRVREEAGERRKEAIAAVAAEAGLPKREVFDAVVAAKNAAPRLESGGRRPCAMGGQSGPGGRQSPEPRIRGLRTKKAKTAPTVDRSRALRAGRRRPLVDGTHPSSSSGQEELA